MKNFSIKIALLIIFLVQPALSAQKEPVSLKSLEKLPVQVRLDSLLKLGWEYREKDSRFAIRCNREALTIAKTTRKISKIAEAYNYLGVIYRNMNEFDSSYYFYKKALRFANLANDSTQMAYSYNNIGGYFIFKGQLFLALENIFKAIEIFEKTHDERGLAFAKIQAGYAYSILENYNEAEKFFNEVLEIRKKSNYKWGIAIAQLLLSKVYIQTGREEKAEKILNQLLVVFSQNHATRMVGNTYNYLGQALQQKGEYKKALEKYLIALDYLKQVSFDVGIVETECGAAYCYYKLGEYDKALAFLDKAIALAKQKNYLHGYLKSLETYFDVYAALRDPEKLSYYARKLISAKDSLYREETILRNAEFKKLFDLHDLERKNVILQKDIEGKKTVIVLSVGFGVLFFAFLLIVIMQNKKIRERSKQLAKALEDKNKLFSIVAHDLKNPFHSLLGYADFLLNELEGDYSIDDIKAGIEHMRVSAQKLLEMVENLLQWARSQTGKIKYNPSVHNIGDLVMETASYFMQSAKTKGVTLEYDLNADDVCYCDKDMISTALRNLISNSIKFTEKGDKIKIYTKKYPEQNKIYITVEDTGVGIPQEQLSNLFSSSISNKGTAGEKGTGLGLLLVKEMVEKNNGEVFVESKLGVGTRFSMSLPIKNSD